jgi:ABC-type multidrug transport system fused ATPase/permease subunit
VPRSVYGNVTFDDVCFVRGSRPVLRASAKLLAGTSAAIIGRAGGKTTLLNLLPRFFDP